MFNIVPQTLRQNHIKNCEKCIFLNHGMCILTMLTV